MQDYITYEPRSCISSSVDGTELVNVAETITIVMKRTVLVQGLKFPMVVPEYLGRNLNNY